MKRPLIDHHMHTNHSPDADSKATMQAYINQAKANGVPGIMFTDHVDMDTPITLFKTYPDYEAYTQEINALKEETFSVRMGVEIGYMSEVKDKLTAFIHRYPFDFVIASIHVGDNLDFYNGDFFKGKTQEEAYQRYFEILLEAVKEFNDYDVVGHLDYIIRYGPYDHKSLDLPKVQGIIDEILTTIIQKGKGIEVNTSGLRYGLGVTHPRAEIIKRYKELGGTIITIGSDAHRIEDYYADLDQSLTLVKAAGFDSITEYKDRKPAYISIK